MTWTWEQVISLALVRSKRVGRNQPIAPKDFSIGQETVNLLLDKLDGQGLALPSFATDIKFDTAPNQAKYLLGPGSGAAYAVRPETIITAVLTISNSPPFNQDILPMSFQAYTRLPFPALAGLPLNYAVNEKFPQMEVFFYPVPDAIYPITLNCKVKWAETAGDPNANWFAIAQVPSGYASSMVDMLALEIAEIDHLATPEMRNKSDSARFQIASSVKNQIRSLSGGIPDGLWGFDIWRAGGSPW